VLRNQFSRIASVIAAVLLVSPCAHADKGDGSFRFEYQFVETGEFDGNLAVFDVGETQAHIFMLSGDYALSDKWTIGASLPYIKKRHQGAFPHNPAIDLPDYPEADQRVLDDGNFHSDWEDLYLTLSYAAYQGERWSVYPFISYGLPTNDYPFYAHAAVGRNLWHVPVGAAFNFTPYFSDFSFGGDAAYVFTEKSIGVDSSHWLINLDLAYYVTPRFAPKIFISMKTGTKGMSQTDFTLPITGIEWYFHDRIFKHNFVNGGFGFDYVVNDKFVVSGSWVRTLEPDNVNVVDLGISLGITRYFAGD
jgi:hypothetical protein